MQGWDIVQITDSHLFKDQERQLLGMNTRSSFDDVISLVRQQSPSIDALLATGDIAQDAGPDSYQRFMSIAHDLCDTVRWIPGNHDLPSTMQELFPFESDPELRVGNWQIIMLNSAVYGKVHGYLNEQELELLAALYQESEQDQAHVLVCLHHHLMPTGADWLDQLDVHNSDEVKAILASMPRVKAVLCGHIHQEMDQVEQGIRYLATPSSCVQFSPRHTDFKVDPLPPGYRTLRLNEDGSIDTQVFRINDLPDVDLDGQGY